MAMIGMISCDTEDDSITNPESESAPTQTPTAAPTPTPEGAWGYIKGEAIIEVSGLPEEPYDDKAVIFCLGNPDNSNWMNVRHRTGNRFQMKGGLDPNSPCVDEVHIHSAPSAANGEWRISWNQNGRIFIESPEGSSTIEIPGGRPAFRNIYDGSCGGYIHHSSPAVIEIKSFTGTVGYAQDCYL